VLACHPHLVLPEEPEPVREVRSWRPLRPFERAMADGRLAVAASPPALPEAPPHTLRLPESPVLPCKIAIVLAALLPLVLG
jgi:hypothetical protein